jgi:hypothetical protein
VALLQKMQHQFILLDDTVYLKPLDHNRFAYLRVPGSGECLVLRIASLDPSSSRGEHPSKWESKYTLFQRQADRSIYKNLHDRIAARVRLTRALSGPAIYASNSRGGNPHGNTAELSLLTPLGHASDGFGHDFPTGGETPMKRIHRNRQWTNRRSLAMVLAAGMALLVAGSCPIATAFAKGSPSDLIVHEWGTFLSMSGSDGTVLDGMYHEEHALPAFVHTRARDQVRLPGIFLKGETPVIYFYTKDRQRVRLGVGFPRGIWTQWYPQAAAVRPSLTDQVEKPGRLGGGRICWFAEVIPAATVPSELTQPRAARPRAEDVLPATSSDALWNYARDVDAAYVRTMNTTKDPAPAEFEKFLFYRGLGETRLPLQFGAGHGGTLVLDRDATLGHGISHVFVIRVENGRGAYRYLPALRPGEQVAGVIPSMERSRPLADFTKSIADSLRAALSRSGLYPKEARAMVSTWTTSYFRTEGIRVLFVLPQSWTDAFIPMTIDPEPKEVVRVMVGRVEMLTVEREQAAETAVRELADRDPAKRARAFRYLHEQGRYVEPIVRRVMVTTTEDGVRTLCRRLLLTELVTDLRAAVCNANDGRWINVHPQLLHSQLARLLREVGLNDQARAEGSAVLEELKPSVPGSSRPTAETPAQIEARATALEAIGDDRGAAAGYAQLVKLKAGSLTGELAPATVDWLREWWVGESYARCLARVGAADSTICELEKELWVASTAGRADTDRSLTLLLAYLRDVEGKKGLAESHWSSLAGKPSLEASAAPSRLYPKVTSRPSS